MGPSSFWSRIIPGLSVANVLIHIANSIYPDQTDRIGTVEYVSTLIESILSNEWQCLKNKTGMYKAIIILQCVMLLTLTGYSKSSFELNVRKNASNKNNIPDFRVSYYCGRTITSLYIFQKTVVCKIPLFE